MKISSRGLRFENLKQMVNQTIELARARWHGEVVAEYDGLDPARGSSLFAVYANYDSFGLVQRYVVEQVTALAKAGYRVIFVSQSRKLQGFEALLPYCAKIIHRRNLGHDFGAYRHGLRWIRALEIRPATVLLANDSCYGYFSSIDKLAAGAVEGGVDLWGLTDSYEYGYHLQSYFLLISARLFQADSFWRFWDRLPAQYSRNYIILHGEIELTQSTLRSGFSTGVQAPYQDLVEDWLERYRQEYGSTESEKRFVTHLENAILTGRPVNPTHYFWEGLITDYRLPVLKKDLLRKNPVSVPNIRRAPTVVTEIGGDFSATLTHLRFKEK